MRASTQFAFVSGKADSRCVKRKGEGKFVCMLEWASGECKGCLVCTHVQSKHVLELQWIHA